LSDRLTKDHPKLAVLFISGYTENAIVHGGELQPGIHFLQKPFRPVDLLAAVQKALEGHGGTD
jgi:FixJ family two-component response regulator